MSGHSGLLKKFTLRHTVLAGVVALGAAAAVIGSAAPAAAFRSHGGGFHHGFGGFHRGFDHRFAFGGFGYFPGYGYDDYAYDTCLRRVWAPYGWRLVNICP